MMPESQVGQLAETAFRGYMAYVASATALHQPAADALISAIEADQQQSTTIGSAAIPRLDGSIFYFSLGYALREIRADPMYQEVYARLWLGGALLTLGDELSRHGYFDRRPDLEFIRHLRNGVAHGNRFNITTGGAKALVNYPARFNGPDRRFLPDGRIAPLGDQPRFEISPSLHGSQVLFDFVGPGDVCDLLMFVGNRLLRIGNGDPPHPLWPQQQT